MPQLDFLIYSYQYTLLFVSFFLLYDLFLNFWLPGFLNGLFLTNKLFLFSQNIYMVLRFFVINFLVIRLKNLQKLFFK
uniref:ATP synthase subunit 8 n=1 Tax=Balamuthia mandrillaris TaxID=66527 RepID=A0A0K1HRH3_9EUKA|nr:ATP synthase subunit 8 [Balamuthia mandrillaris]AKT94885.1 ATP synthase subunit 8 [Balamuthia mandrillaris]